MSLIPRTGRYMPKDHPFFSRQSLFRATIEPALGDDAGRECIERHLNERCREAALAEWDAGRASDPPLDWGFSSDVNAALQDYLRRTSSPPADSSTTPPPPSQATQITDSLAAAPSTRHARAIESRTPSRDSSRSSPTEIPSVVIVGVRAGAREPIVVRSATAFPGCGARNNAEVPGPEQTRGLFRIVVELAEFPADVRVLLLMFRADEIARLGRLLEAPRSTLLPDFHDGLDELLRNTRPLRDATEAATILQRLAREFADLEDERWRCTEGTAKGIEQNPFEPARDHHEPVNAALRRYFWLVSLLASTPVFERDLKLRRGQKVFDETFRVESTLRFPSSDLYCVLMVDG
ncbi:MAG: hypothetical protein U1A77_09975 [Pirellulales bacterium]